MWEGSIMRNKVAIISKIKMTFLGFLFFRQKKAIIQRTFTIHWKQYVKSVQITYFLGNITYDTYFPIKNKHTNSARLWADQP